MIRNLAVLAALWSFAAHAEDEATSAVPVDVEDHSIDANRSPVDALTESMIGSASKSVRFDWRRSPVAFALLGSELLERNNFGSTRLGLLSRKAFGDLLVELGVNYVFTWETDSSRKLSLTPYRQFARPARLEIDVNVAYALAEGVVTALPSVVPPAQMVLSANAGVRYLYYPGALEGADALGYAAGLTAPALTQVEIENLEGTRLPGMQVDLARYGLLTGLCLDVYLQPGLLVTPRAMLAIPIFAPFGGSGLGWWWELSVGLGWAL